MNAQVSVETLQKVANYLSFRPWTEVNQLLQELSQAKPIEETKTEEVKKSK